MMTKVAQFAGGCFWCMQPPFDKLKGVTASEVGQVNGNTPNPTYQQVCSGSTGYTEGIKVTQDPEAITYLELCKTLFKNIDPTTVNGQFADKGTQQRTGIQFETEEEKTAAESAKDWVQGYFDKPVATEIVAFKNWYKGEDYHQNQYKTNSGHYEGYSVGSGRKPFIKSKWNE